MLRTRPIEWRMIGRRLSPAASRTRTEWVVDGCLFGVALVMIVASPFEHPQIPAVWWPWDISLGVLVASAIWWTRRYPLLIGILVIIPGAIAISAGAGTLICVYRMGLLGRIVPGLIITAVHIATALPYHAVLPLPGLPWIVWAIMIPLLYAFFYCVGLLGRARRQVIEGLRATAARDRQEYERRLAAVRRDERELIAREMHDVLAHRISLVSMHAGALEFRAASDAPLSPSDLRDATGVIRENAYGAVDDLRDLLGLLRSDAASSGTAPQPKLADLDGLLAEAEAVGQQVDFSRDVRPETLRESTQRTAYRVVQEGLTNARKHAPDSPVTVRLEQSGDQLTIRVGNPVPPGVTSADDRSTGNGLIGLDERVRLEGGTFEAYVDDGEFRLEAVLETAGSKR